MRKTSRNCSEPRFKVRLRQLISLIVIVALVFAFSGEWFWGQQLIVAATEIVSRGEEAPDDLAEAGEEVADPPEEGEELPEDFSEAVEPQEPWEAEEQVDNFAQEKAESEEETEPESAAIPSEYADVLLDVPRPEDAWPTLEEIGSRAYIVIDADTEDILLEYNSEEEAYPASMTKIMTAIVVLEHPDYAPDKPVYFTERACTMPAPESTTAGLLPGEVAPTISCLYMMMVLSANEIANALAENYGGSLEGFVELMNQKAEELGCEHTNFVDPCGFGYIDHHTTAKDMAKIARYAMQNPLFQEIVSCRAYSMPPTNLHPMSAWSNQFNGNYLVTFQDSYRSPWLKSIDGIKRGDTDIAGTCLASAATTYDGRHIIAVLFDAVFLGTSETYVGVVPMSRTLLEEGAKAMGAPRTEEAVAQNDAYYAWPSMQDPYLARSTEPEVTQETFVIPAWPEPTEQAIADDEVVVNRLSLTLLITFLVIFIFTALILGYSLWHKRRQEKLLQRYTKLDNHQSS